MLRAVLFDLDNTLLLEDEATDRALLAAATLGQRRHGVDAPVLARAASRAADRLFRAAPTCAYADAIGVSGGEALWGAFTGDHPGLRALRDYAPRFRLEVWSAALGAVGIGSDEAVPLARDLADAFVRARTAEQLEDPAAGEVLETLGARYRLALVTNGAPDVQRAKLAGTALAHWFEVVVISGELGAGKPDPAPVLAALAALDVRPDEAVMVGDSLERDGAAARAAGVYAVWLDRDSRHLASKAGKAGEASRVRGRKGLAGPSGECARITSLRDLPALLAALPPPPASPPGSCAPRPE